MKKLLRIYGLIFLATTAVAVTNADKKLLDANEDKVAQMRQLKALWNAM
jgi:hypothetical protein